MHTPKTGFMLLMAVGLMSCSSRTESAAGDQPQTMKAEKPFSAGGNIDMQLSGGDYVIRPASDDHIRVLTGGNAGTAVTELTANGANANLAIRDTPRNNFHGTIEVPHSANLVVHLSAGNLAIGAIEGNKEIDSKAGNVEIAVPNANDYASVNASVTVGDLNSGPFGGSSSGLSPRLAWSGPGKYTLRATLGAGNLELKK